MWCVERGFKRVMKWKQCNNIHSDIKYQRQTWWGKWDCINNKSLPCHISLVFMFYVVSLAS